MANNKMEYLFPLFTVVGHLRDYPTWDENLSTRGTSLWEEGTWTCGYYTKSFTFSKNFSTKAEEFLYSPSNTSQT